MDAIGGSNRAHRGTATVRNRTSVHTWTVQKAIFLSAACRSLRRQNHSARHSTPAPSRAALVSQNSRLSWKLRYARYIRLVWTPQLVL